MDEDVTFESLRDELALDIERALAVDPDPALQVRVRARINRERARYRWWGRWQAASLGTAVLAIGVVTTLLVVAPAPAPESGVPTHQAATIAPMGSPLPSVATAQARSAAASPASPAPLAARRRVSVGRAGRADPEVLVPPDQAPALRLLAANLRAGRIDPSVLADVRPFDGPVAPLHEITISPIVIEPLARLELVEGAQQ